MTRSASHAARIATLPALGALLALGAAPPLVPAPLGAQSISVGKNVRVSTERSGANHHEVWLGIDPADTRRLLACSHLFDSPGNTIRTVNYLSTDRGQSWKLLREVDGGKISGDPICEFGIDGSIQLVSLIDRPTVGEVVLALRTPDMGRTWDSTSLSWIDREYLTVDRGGGRHHGRTYLHGTGFLKPFDPGGSVSALAVAVSTDSGRTYRDWLKMPSVDRRWILGMGNGVVTSTGRFGILFGELHSLEGGIGQDPAKPDARLKFAASDSGGTSFERAVVVADWKWCNRYASHIPALAVDGSRGAFRDRLYAVWRDGGKGQCNIVLAHSSDGGRSWSKPVVVNDDADRAKRDVPGAEKFIPVVAVNRDGVVGVAWFDSREDTTHNAAWKLHFAASLDGGETFTPSVAVSEAAMAPSWESRRSAHTFGSDGGAGDPLSAAIGLQEISSGDTGGLVADAEGVFHTIWLDNRTGTDQMWTAPVTVRGVVARHGAPELAGHVDVTGQLAAEYRNTRFDSRTRTLTLEVVLRNTSGDTLRGPIRLRATGIRSALGTVRPQGADGGSERHPVWTVEVPGGVLRPGETTAPRRLTFTLSDVRPIRYEPRPGESPFLVQLEARLLAPPTP